MNDALPVLADIAARCTASDELDGALGPVLRWLSERLELHRATLALLDAEHDQIRVEAAHGLTPAEIRRAQILPETSITGGVIRTGRPAGVLRISAEPRFADWTRLAERGLDPAYVCVPVMSTTRCIGALGAYRLGATPERLAADLHLLATVSGLLAPLVRRHHRRAAHRAPAGPSGGRTRPSNIIGSSKAMRVVFELIQQVASSTTTVLITGESGTGKELVAQALHRSGPRPDGPFIKVNSAALPEGVIESELFGHEKGSFTGALRQRKGRFERARGGTLFLDEIGDLSAATQIKLLRVLQEGEFERVGGLETVRTDARIITATSRNLEEMIVEGTFRADLYYRLNVFPIWLPPLRERRADILLLADHFIGACNLLHGRRVRRISTSAIDMLMAYHWPGNVRELENCIERAVLMARDDVILGHHLPPTLQTAEASDTTQAREGLTMQLDALEREILLDALKTSRGNMAKAARMLKITDRQMGTRVKKYGIGLGRFKRG
ncbi:MAG: sigma 54-interacting transcriptional regulator [Myxococcota bacterium]|nr:sigma 54-interacting transcriptional regulator [Myxococcota bacterium]